MTAFIMAALLLGMNEDLPMCFSSDVQKLCCPSACATKDSSKWDKANEVLRGCARGIGCKDVDSWTVGMKCNCSRGN